MKRVVAEPSWSAIIIHDTDNDELSLQELPGWSCLPDVQSVDIPAP